MTNIMISLTIVTTITATLIIAIYTKNSNFIEKSDDNAQEEALKEYVAKKAAKSYKKEQNKRIY